ncbi:hypothetical protein F0562_021312 [Nyssa sinensis]|uniref:Endonuclease/exonuclease/phosphatase domain-containing protein n=1 Tax=Nyssa sinensis TaxID=561372 RepID=A0A5J5BJ81_9ASTE|nr:hypothetical protein F0562_021312 [Nyssa sinensis]
MQSREAEAIFCDTHFSAMLKEFNKKLRRICSRLWWPIRCRSKRQVVVKKFGKSNSAQQESYANGSAAIHPNSYSNPARSEKTIRIATFNAALFSMAPAVPKHEKSLSFDFENEDYPKTILKQSMGYDLRAKSVNDRPKSILKQSPLHPSSMNTPANLSKQQKFAKSKLKVSINLPDNEISLKRRRQLSFAEGKREGSSSNTISRILRFPSNTSNGIDGNGYGSNRTVLEVLRELDADILAFQDVKAEEEKAMKPLSDLAGALGMNYVFAESWAPEYGNAILSKWPIKRWKVHQIFDDTDFRNVLKATIDIPQTGEVNFHCTHLDHLDENWRMKQMNAIIESNDSPHILAGGLNSLDETDYSTERWTDIVKYYEEMGKPPPKADVMRFLKSKQYRDAKDFAGECESVVMITKGQSVQGTCKYGTRVDYILASKDSPFKFVPGSYSVLSSKGTSDHHIVKVDVSKVDSSAQLRVKRKQRQGKQKVVKMTNSLSKGIWRESTDR